VFTMTPNVLRNFFKKSSTRLYPKETRETFERARGELYNEIENCIFCRTCARKCPSQCINVDTKEATWQCDPFACVYCGVCVESCPQKCLHQKRDYRKPTTEKTVIYMKGELKKKHKEDPEEVESSVHLDSEDLS
jgi:ech hydrogenase subunit F